MWSSSSNVNIYLFNENTRKTWAQDVLRSGAVKIRIIIPVVLLRLVDYIIFVVLHNTWTMWKTRGKRIAINFERKSDLFANHPVQLFVRARCTCAMQWDAKRHVRFCVCARTEMAGNIFFLNLSLIFFSFINQLIGFFVGISPPLPRFVRSVMFSTEEKKVRCSVRGIILIDRTYFLHRF